MPHNFNLHEDVSPSMKKKKPTGVIGLLLKLGLAKNKKQANVVMIIFILIGISAIVYLNLRTFGG